MNHDKATEEFFRLRGWERIDDYDTADYHFWYNPEDIDPLAPGFGQELYENLPNICESMPDWLKYVAEFMEGEGLVLFKGSRKVWWFHTGTYKVYGLTVIKNHSKAKKEVKGLTCGSIDTSVDGLIKTVREVVDISLMLVPILYASVLAANEYLKVRQHDIGGNEK